MKQLKILFAEDVINDMELAEWELKKAGIDFISLRVESKDEYIKQLKEFNPDIVISDYSMPSFDGMTALSIALEMNPEMPVIIHTGSINEETAVSCIKAGASDYILKDKLLRLPYAVKESFQKARINKENKAANAALRASEEKYKELFNSMAQGVLYLSNQGDINMVNPAARQILEIENSNALHVTNMLTDWVIKSEDGTLIKTEEYIKSEAFTSGEKVGNVVVSAFNERLNIQKWLSVNVIPQFRTEETIPYQAFITIEDITGRKLVEIELARSESKFRNLFENSPIGIYTSLLDGTITFANDAMVKLFKYNSAQELYNTSFDHIYVDMADREVLINELKEMGFVKNYELLTKTKCGKTKNLLLSALLANNQITGMIMDITDRKESELELLAAKQKAEESDKLKTAFLANLSHEVRTPMNAIMGFSDLLVDLDNEDETIKMYVNTIRDNSIQLLGIITDIIEISKIETEKVITHISEFKLDSFKPLIEELYLSKIEKKGLKLNIKGIDPTILVNSDEQKLSKVILNLVDNALKFTEKGEITILFELRPDILQVSVKDTGIGISEGHDELIFERFRQSDIGYDRKHGGTGLGLSIAKAFVAALGGKIWFTRNTDGGTTFTFSVPAKWKSTVVKDYVAQVPDLSKYTILVAEDDNINFVFISSLLAPTKAKIINASNGIEAVETVKANPAIDLILMDIKMPLMNGYEATRIIKESNISIPIIATTAYAMSGDKEKCIEAGCDGYISKPIKRNELLKAIDTFLGSK